MFNLKGWWALAVVGASSLVTAQSINADINIPTDPELGGGPPSNAFGAAAGQFGYWNAVPAGEQTNIPLKDLSGGLTGVMFTAFGTGGSGAWNNPANTGDFALLFNDADRIGDEGLQYTLTGLAAGRYLVYTYSVRPNGFHGEADITVPGSITPNPQHVAGTMPGNGFEYLRTHTIHEIVIGNGELRIQASAAANNFINGFQIIAVPEPTTLAACLTGLVFVAGTRRRCRR
jgi:hypothetical protein